MCLQAKKWYADVALVLSTSKFVGGNWESLLDINRQNMAKTDCFFFCRMNSAFHDPLMYLPYLSGHVRKSWSTQQTTIDPSLKSEMWLASTFDDILLYYETIFIYVFCVFATCYCTWWLTISRKFPWILVQQKKQLIPRYFETYTRKVSRVGSSWKVALCQSQGGSTKRDL